ncbi:hypothetical protein H6P81_010128 [Aristolochia fimbriata]|uniref:Uncharacterized protein n=1 Tax=Aristolochia fimbriata TaxID=158543 RepID=A0AAV7EN59_ARIFI|nr:hypothetical protein H6P81_010128 [Aristolochia fimbriata]
MTRMFPSRREQFSTAPFSGCQQLHPSKLAASPDGYRHVALAYYSTPCWQVAVEPHHLFGSSGSSKLLELWGVSMARPCGQVCIDRILQIYKVCIDRILLIYKVCIDRILLIYKASPDWGDLRCPRKRKEAGSGDRLGHVVDTVSDVAHDLLNELEGRVHGRAQGPVRRVVYHRFFVSEGPILGPREGRPAADPHAPQLTGLAGIQGYRVQARQVHVNVAAVLQHRPHFLRRVSGDLRARVSLPLVFRCHCCRDERSSRSQKNKEKKDEEERGIVLGFKGDTTPV